MKRLVGAVLIALVAAMFFLPLYSPAPDVPDGGILVLELEGRIEESPALDPLAQFAARGPALPSLLLLLDMAAADERIEQLVVRVRPLDCGYARLQELRAAVRRVRDAGKRVIAVLDLATLNATREYYLASAADRIYVDPGHLGPVAASRASTCTWGACSSASAWPSSTSASGSTSRPSKPTPRAR